MTGKDENGHERHQREAERRLSAGDERSQQGFLKTAMHEVAMAQVHATLALAAATAAQTDEHLIVLPRPSDPDGDGLDYEGGSYEDDDETGWQVVPYSSTKNWVCRVEEADSVLFRGAGGPTVGGSHISLREARRFAAALAALADRVEKS